MFIGCSREEAELAAEELGIDLPPGSNVMSLEANRSCPTDYRDYGVEHGRRHCVEVKAPVVPVLPALPALPALPYTPSIMPVGPVSPATANVIWRQMWQSCPPGYRSQIAWGRRRCTRAPSILSPTILRNILTRYVREEPLSVTEQRTVDDLETRGLLEQRLQSFGLLSGLGDDRPLLTDWVSPSELEAMLRSDPGVPAKAAKIDAQFAAIGRALLAAVKTGKFRKEDGEILVYSFGKQLGEWRNFARTDQYLLESDLATWAGRALGWRQMLASRNVSVVGKGVDWRTRKRKDEGLYAPAFKPQPGQVRAALVKHMRGDTMTALDNYIVAALKKRGILGRAMAKFGIVSSESGFAADRIHAARYR